MFAPVPPTCDWLAKSRFPTLPELGLVVGAGALSVVAGRLLCDTYLAARELVREVDYTLSTLARNLLKQERAELAAADVPGGFFLWRAAALGFPKYRADANSLTCPCDGCTDGY